MGPRISPLILPEELQVTWHENLMLEILSVINFGTIISKQTFSGFTFPQPRAANLTTFSWFSINFAAALNLSLSTSSPAKSLISSHEISEGMLTAMSQGTKSGLNLKNFFCTQIPAFNDSFFSSEKPLSMLGKRALKALIRFVGKRQAIDTSFLVVGTAFKTSKCPHFLFCSETSLLETFLLL